MAGRSSGPAPALRGTAERLLQAGLEADGVGQVVRPVTVAELAGLQAAFASNANGLQPIRAIDGVEYSVDADAGPGRPAAVCSRACAVGDAVVATASRAFRRA